MRVGPTQPKDNRVRIPGRPTKKLWARTNEDKGRTGKEGQGQDGQGRTRAGRTRKVKDRTRARIEYGQDAQGTKMGWDGKKLDANSSR